MLSYLAQVAELADALASGASVRKDVGVQVPPGHKIWLFSPENQGLSPLNGGESLVFPAAGVGLELGLYVAVACKLCA